MSVIPTEQIAKSASTPKTGFFATLRGLLHVKGVSAPKTIQGSGVPSPRRVLVSLSVLATALGALAFASAPAFAAALEKPETGSPTGVKVKTATLNGVLSPKSPGEVGSTYDFLYRASATECKGGGATSPVVSIMGLEAEPVSEPVMGLAPGTTYMVCLVVHNQAKTEEVVGSAVTFTTMPSPLPEAYATNLTASSATLHAVLDPEGSSLSYHFEYGTTVAYGSQTPEVGTSVTDVEAHVQDLSAATLYHYRVIATDAAHETFASEDHTFTTQHNIGESALPDGRQYEMVTPPEKEGALFKALGGDEVIQASANGDAIADRASQPTEAEPKGFDEPVSVLSTRGAGGTSSWSSQDIEGEHEAVGGIIIGEGNESRFFSEDLSHVVTQQLGDFTPLSPEASEPTPYLRTNYFNGNVSEHCEGSYLTAGSCFQPLVTSANTREGATFGEVVNGVCPRFFCGPHFVVGTPDLSHIVLVSREVLTPNAVNTSSNVPQYDYEWSGGRLQPLPGHLPEQFPNFYNNPVGLSHAISINGDRIIVEHEGRTGGGLELFDVAKGETIRLDVPEPGCGTCSSGDEGFQTANGEASRIFFIDNGPLTAAHSASGEDLYECEIVEVAGKLKCNLSNLTPSAGASEVLGASQDGSYIYFAASAGLAPGSVQGECSGNEHFAGGITGGCDVYVRHDGVTRLVAPSWIEGGNEAATLTRVSPDGRWLAFVSRNSLTGYDNREAASGQPDAEVYLYHAETSPSGALEAGKLVCASCDPTGARPVSAYVSENGKGVQGWVAATPPSGETYGSQGQNTVYQSRYLSDSGRLFFNSYGALVPQDVNGNEDVYEYEPEGVPAGEHACSSSSTSGSEVFKPARAFEGEGVHGEEGAGCLALISSGTSSEPSSFLDASESGGDVFFLTISKLTPQDFDDATDVYDAHECTVPSPCSTSVVVPPACTTEASCKPPPTPQPAIYGLPSSATFSGPGNVVGGASSLPSPKKVTKKTVKCKKGLAKSKQGKCVKKPKKSSKKAKKASNDRRIK